MSVQETFPLRGRRVWVTGAHGFLGRHLVRELRERGADVLEPTRAECDLLEHGAAERFLAAHRPAAVVHLAARVGGIGANQRHPGEFFYANLAMGLHLIEASRAAGVEKLVVLGSVCSYPKLTPTPFREDDLWNGYPEETNAPYGIAKKALLVQLQAYREEYGTRGIFLIPVNLYGPGDDLDLQNNHVIPALVRKFLEARARGQERVQLWGSGRPTREFLYVEDAARGIAEGLARYEDSEPVNLGTGDEISIQDLAHKIRDLVGYRGEIVFDPSLPDGQPRRRLDVSRAERSFGWKARVPLDEGLRHTVRWAREELGL